MLLAIRGLIATIALASLLLGCGGKMRQRDGGDAFVGPDRQSEAQRVMLRCRQWSGECRHDTTECNVIAGLDVARLEKADECLGTGPIVLCDPVDLCLQVEGVFP